MSIARWVLVIVAGCLGTSALAGERCSALTGDTLRCGRERVKVEGLEPGGDEARERLQRRLNAGEIIIQRRGRDRFGRTLGRLYVNGNRITRSDLEQPGRTRNRRL